MDFTTTLYRLAAALALAFVIQDGITVTNNEAVVTFPGRIDFEVSATSSANIESANLTYRTDALSCGESVSQAIAEDFEPGTDLDLSYEWDLRQTGTMPPGTTVTWQWTLTSTAGESVTTPEQTVLFTDQNYAWRTVQTERLILYWYEGDENFANQLLDEGEAALDRLQEDTGVVIEQQVQLFIYGSPGEMQQATLFAPDWSGGLAFSNFGTVLIGIDPGSLDWGLRTVAHELTHVVVGYYTFSCLNSMPIWANEGLAQWAEGGMEPYYASLLGDAIADDSLFSVRELGSPFSNDPDLATLSYAQSESIVRFLIETYGQEKILELLQTYQRGVPEDQALLAVYGFDRDGLEAEWRASVNAAPMQASDLPSTNDLPTRTPFPTLMPVTAPQDWEAGTEPLPQAATQPPAQNQATPAGPSTGGQGGRLNCAAPALMLVAVGLTISHTRTFRSKKR